jgi:hypothetical protein
MVDETVAFDITQSWRRRHSLTVQRDCLQSSCQPPSPHPDISAENVPELVEGGRWKVAHAHLSEGVAHL